MNVVIKALTAQRDDLQDAIRRDLGVMRGHNTVLRTEHGLYLCRRGEFFAPRGILLADMYTPEDAATLVQELESPEGNPPTAALYHHALRDELQDIERALEQFAPTPN